MDATISICITTCDRPELLEQALWSCFAQERVPDEIVIGDDSTSQATQDLVAGLCGQTSIRINYRKNEPRLGQNANMNSVFDHSSGSHIVLLHDDDLLLPNALRTLIACWEEHPDLTAAYGKQYIISHDGQPDQRATQKLNVAYNRVAGNAGLQSRPLDVGITQQFPNDGYMVLAAAARAIGWRPRTEVGYGGEYDFGLRLAATYSKFYFVDAFVAKYRRTLGESITRSGSDDSALQSYRILSTLSVPMSSAPAKAAKLGDLAPSAIAQAIRLGRKREAWDIYRSRNYPLLKRVAPGGVRKLLGLVMP